MFKSPDAKSVQTLEDNIEALWAHEEYEQNEYIAALTELIKEAQTGVYDDMERLNGLLAVLYVERAEAHEELEEFAAQKRDLALALELTPHDLLLIGDYIWALEAIGQYEEALQAAEQAVADFPDQSQSHSLKAAALNLLNRPQEALEAYRQAAQLASFAEKSHAYTGIGVTLNALGRYSEAIESLNQAIEKTQAKAAVPLKHKGYALYKLGRYQEAIKALGQAFKLTGGSGALALLYRACAHTAIGARHKALADYTVAKEIIPLVKPKFAKDLLNRAEKELQELLGETKGA